MEGYSCTFTRRWRLGNQIGCKNGASSRPRWTTIWRFNALQHNQASTGESVSTTRAHEISQKIVGYTWFMKAAISKDSNTARNTRIPCVIFEQFKDTLVVFQQGQNWWITRFFPHNWTEYIFHTGISWNSQSFLVSAIIPRGKENDKARQALHNSESIRKRPRWRKSSWWLHCSSGGTLSNLMGTQSRCGMLDKIVQSARSRIAILANKIICNHHLRHSARRLHWPCDFSERRPNNIREDRNTKASTQGYVEEQVTYIAAAATAAAAAAYSRKRRQ